MTPSYPDSDRALDEALATGAGNGRLCQSLRLHRPWADTPDTLTLDATYRISREATGTRVQARLGEHELFLDQPLRLEPVAVAKPWGREIWYTGIEARGESGVCTAAGILPISQYLALAPRRLIRHAPLVLLKVLDPKPQPVLGDLYFEVHEHKREVYVVSHVDPGAWPEGRGGIRFGMNQALRRRYGDDAAFRADYLAAVKAYERVRRAIDAGDPVDGDPVDGDPVEPAQEAALRAAMNRFTAVRPLTVGDVVVVPPWLPHSLQHGVRVIEFQTPTYERYIISFAQRVLTQDHWDSDHAVARMRLDSPPQEPFRRVADGVERIVDFEDFRVWRVTLPAAGALTLPTHPSYAVCMVVRGSIELTGLSLGPEEAAFVPAIALAQEHGGRPATLTNTGQDSAIVLVAAPDL